MLDLLGEIAKLRIREGLANELVRSATEHLEHLHRGLASRDPFEQERAAGKIPAAEIEVRKWRKAASDYVLRRELYEAELRDSMRVLTA